MPTACEERAADTRSPLSGEGGARRSLTPVVDAPSDLRDCRPAGLFGHP
ncbi:hypothetical protein [Streptomyces sp. KL116D]